jgi:hypothetical protein
MIPAQRLLLSELTSALGEGNITLAKEHGGTGVETPLSSRNSYIKTISLPRQARDTTGNG